MLIFIELFHFSLVFKRRVRYNVPRDHEFVTLFNAGEFHVPAVFTAGRQMKQNRKKSRRAQVYCITRRNARRLSEAESSALCQRENGGPCRDIFFSIAFADKKYNCWNRKNWRWFPAGGKECPVHVCNNLSALAEPCL